MERRSSRVILSIKPSTVQALKNIAAEHELSMGRMVELMMRYWMIENKKKAY